MLDDFSKVPYQTAREIQPEEISGLVDEFGTIAENAIKAGADGVELHGANGYLLHSFLAKQTNFRSDAYGGSAAKRSRFFLEVVDKCLEKTDGRLAVKISPGASFNGLMESEEEIADTYNYFLKELEKRKIVYLHISDHTKVLQSFGVPLPDHKVNLFKRIRDMTSSKIIVNGKFSVEDADNVIASGTADAVSFGTAFINNPDLVNCIKLGHPLRPPVSDPAIFYGHPTDPRKDHIGFIDYNKVCTPF